MHFFIKKIPILFFAIFITLLFNFTYTFSQNLIEIDLEYDGEIHKYSAEEIKINLNSELITEYDIPPIILNNRTLVPLRSVVEKMGASVFWDATEKKVIITKDSDTIIFEINSNIITKNSIEKIEIDVPAKIINNFTMIPIRAVSEAFSCLVDWDSETKTINIYQEDFINNQDLESSEEFYSNSTGLKILWDQISNVNANNLDSKREVIEGLDVLSPTWFAISNSDGDITDKGSLDYAQWAKEQGYQIWGLVTNSFDSNITHNTLSNPEIRAKIINTLCDLADKYSLDGINIDFENVAKDDGDYYLQFIKEATPIFKSKGLIVSVDMYIPTAWTAHYQMEEVGKIVDYVIIMAYDEHYSTSTESGSTASITWVDNAMANAVELVDNDKLIMGVPFYTRVWSEELQDDGTIKVTNKSLTMQEAYDLLIQNNANITWLESAGQFYGEYVEDGITKKIWLEDENSIEERMKVSIKYNVAGIACWKRGHEKPEVWDVINKYYK